MNLEQEHRKVFLTNLCHFKDQLHFTDIAITVQGVNFQAHKLILASHSAYFHSMFSNEMLESKESKVNISGVTSDGFANILNYIYTSKIDLNPSNIQTTLQASIYLQIDPVINHCSEYLQNILDTNNCTDISQIADLYSLQILQEKVSAFIDTNFVKITESDCFHKLTPEQVLSVVSKDMTICVTELDFLGYILKWFLKGKRSEYKIKCAYAESILQYIRFFEITPKDLNLILEQIYQQYDFQKDDCPVYRTLLRIANKPENLLRVPISKHVFNKRGMQQAIVKIGGFDSTGLTNDISYCFLGDKESKEWKALTVIPHVEQCNYGSTVCNNELYIAGGCFNDLNLQEVIHPYAFLYNPLMNTWTKIPSMKMDRCRFTLNALNGQIYAVAGATGRSGDDTNSVEKYCLSTRQWSPAEGLPEGRQRHAACTFANSLFVCGGLQNNRVIASMFVYNVDGNSWSSCAPLLTPRADHFMVAFRDKLYVCGGWRDGDDHQVLVPTIDAYDLRTNTWSCITTIPTPRYHAAVVADGSQIYFVGGFSSETLFDKNFANTECYNLVSNTWTIGDMHTQNFWEHSCVTLFIPKHRTQ